MSFSNIIWTTVNNTSYAVSNTFICKHMINPEYKKVILLSCVIMVYFRKQFIRHVIKIF